MSGRLSMGHLELLLLSGLAPGPAHGYALIARIRDQSEGHFDLPEGTVYPALQRLEDDGIVASTHDVVNGRRRRVYQLTPAGAEALEARRTQWTRFSAGIEGVLGWET